MRRVRRADLLLCKKARWSWSPARPFCFGEGLFGEGGSFGFAGDALDEGKAVGFAEAGDVVPAGGDGEGRVCAEADGDAESAIDGPDGTGEVAFGEEAGEEAGLRVEGGAVGVEDGSGDIGDFDGRGWEDVGDLTGF
jgi:hypothetical protein